MMRILDPWGRQSFEFKRSRCFKTSDFVGLGVGWGLLGGSWDLVSKVISRLQMG